MPTGPKGEKRPADVIGNAVHVMRIATGEVVEVSKHRDQRAIERGKIGGEKGGKVRAANLSRGRRVEIAKHAARSRWKTSEHSE